MRLIFYNEARELQDYQRFANSRWRWLTKPGQQNNASIHFFYPQWTKKKQLSQAGCKVPLWRAIRVLKTHPVCEFFCLGVLTWIELSLTHQRSWPPFCTVLLSAFIHAVLIQTPKVELSKKASKNARNQPLRCKPRCIRVSFVAGTLTPYLSRNWQRKICRGKGRVIDWNVSSADSATIPWTRPWASWQKTI